MHLFYTPELNSDDEFFVLSPEESKHCCKVLRLDEGSTVILVDGRGGWYTAQIVQANAKRTEVKIDAAVLELDKRNHYLHIAVAPTKNIDRFEWFLEKATELGIDEISPIICERSERRELKTERLNRRITAAMKQSLKAYHPRLNEPLSLKNFLDKDYGGNKFIAHCMPGEKAFISGLLSRTQDCLILIGPEGDFTPAEAELALAKGFCPVSLGAARLRTETAALAVCFEVNLLNR